MKIAAFQKGDIEEVKRLFVETFSVSEGEAEGRSIGSLVDDLVTATSDDDLYGFVAVENKQIIGGIFFSRLTFAKEVSAFLLSPVAIRTDCQRRGIGQKLIDFGLKTLKGNGVELIFTYGDPKFYCKVGFNPIMETLVKAPFKLTYPEGWLGQSMINDEIEPIAGNSQCVDAFNKSEIW